MKALPAERISAVNIANVRPANRYKPIENYGVIGNLHTVALVGIDGSIDWCCLPHFDSPSIFGAILDADRGGYFRIYAVRESTHKQMYFSDTNILLTRFLNPDGVGEIIDFMPIAADPTDDKNAHELYRILRVVKGKVRFRIECYPVFNYGREKPLVRKHKCGFVFHSRDMDLALHSAQPLKINGGGVWGEFTLNEGDTRCFVLRYVEKGCRQSLCSLPEHCNDAFESTGAYWRNWIRPMKYSGRWREMVTRSALVLKLLTFAPSGAIVAAPTMGLPEVIRGSRNWDYRYSWIRDASFTLYGLLRLGFSDEAAAFMNWLQERMKEIGPDGSLKILYGLHGEQQIAESELNYLEGYRGSRPVRVGNEAGGQLQLDIYGELMDSVYLYNKFGSPIGYELWANLRKLLGYVCRHWKDKDRGIWEFRAVPTKTCAGNGAGDFHFTYSKVMCWVAVDRGLRLAQKRSLPADWGLWVRTRDEIYEDIMRNGWNPRLRSFVQYYGSERTDASTLIMPLVKFISPTDPRMIGTIDRIKNTLVSDSLVKRYEYDSAVAARESVGEGSFSMCTFWYVEALARAGRAEEARWVFEKMLSYANHLGLFAEEIGPSGEQLGNFPQAFTHLGLISAAYNLNKILG
jgi:GH15 family glucan-1,4-alpha-glucosidase